MIVEVRGDVVPPHSVPIDCYVSVTGYLVEGLVDLIEPLDFVVVEGDASCFCGAKMASDGRSACFKDIARDGERHTVGSDFTSG